MTTPRAGLALRLTPNESRASRKFSDAFAGAPSRVRWARAIVGAPLLVLAGLWLALAACGGDDPAADGPLGDGADAAPDGVVTDSSTSTPASMCNGEGFCWDNPRSHGFTFRSIWASGKDDVWGVGYPGAILRFDGTAWKQFTVPSFASFSSVWGSGPNDVWAGGYEFSGQQRTVIFHFDGTAWTLSYTAPFGDGFRHLNGMWGSGPNDVWAIGDGGTILHFDGATWSPKESGVTDRLFRIVGTSATDAWIVPQRFEGELELLHYDGTHWNKVATHRTIDNSVQGVGSGGANDLWLVISEPASVDAGDSSKRTFLHFDGANWTSSDSPFSTAYVSMWAGGPNDVWAVGTTKSGEKANGAVLHYDGAKWSPVSLDPALGASGNLVGVWGTGPNNVWIHDSAKALLLHFDGAAWTSSPRSGFVGNVTDVWAAAAEDIWSVGITDDANNPAGVILHYDGRSWEQRDVGAIGPLTSIRGSAANNIWAVGGKGTVVRYDGAAWSSAQANLGAGTDLAETWTSGPNDVWVVGKKAAATALGYEGAAFHFDGQTWTSIVPPGLTRVAHVWGSSPKDVWASGFSSASAELHHYDGSAWSPVSTVAEIQSNAIWGTGPKDVWVGTWHFDGTEWKAAPTDPHVAIASMWGQGSSDIWMSSALGEVLHYDGAKWSLVTVLQSAASGIAGSTKEVFFVGAAGMIIGKKL